MIENLNISLYISNGSHAGNYKITAQIEGKSSYPLYWASYEVGVHTVLIDRSRPTPRT
jgi:hypothetical protein